MRRTKVVENEAIVEQSNRLISLFCNHLDYLQLLFEMIGIEDLVKFDTAVCSEALRKEYRHICRSLVVDDEISCKDEMIWFLTRGIKVRSMYVNCKNLPIATQIFSYKLHSVCIRGSKCMENFDLLRLMRAIYGPNSQVKRLMLQDVTLLINDAELEVFDKTCGKNVLEAAVFKKCYLQVQLCCVLDTKFLTIEGCAFLNTKYEDDLVDSLKRLKSLKTLTLGNNSISEVKGHYIPHKMSKNFFSVMKKVAGHVMIDTGFLECVLCGDTACPGDYCYMAKILNPETYLIEGKCHHRICDQCADENHPIISDLQIQCTFCPMTYCMPCLEDEATPKIIKCVTCSVASCLDCMEMCSLCKISKCLRCTYKCEECYCVFCDDCRTVSECAKCLQYMCCENCTKGNITFCKACDENICKYCNYCAHPYCNHSFQCTCCTPFHICQCGREPELYCEHIRTVCSICTKVTSCWHCEGMKNMDPKSIENKDMVPYDTRCPQCDQIMCLDCLDNTVCSAGYYHTPKKEV